MATSVRARPLIFYVLLLAAAMTVPPLVLAAVTTTRWVTAERARLQTATRETTERALSHVDRFLAGKVAMLQALATSPAIEAADFERLDAQSRELLDLQGLNIVMRKPDGQQIINTRVPWGTPLPRVPNYSADQVVLTTNRPMIADLYRGVMAGAWLARIVVPVKCGGETCYTLTASLGPAALSAMLREAGIAAPYFGSIADRDGLIIARASHDEARVGTVLPGFAQAPGREGTWTGRNPEGVQVYGTYRRSDLSGWFFAVGVDQAVLDASLYRSLWWLGSLALGLGLIAVAASVFVARRIILSHRQIASVAGALGSGQPVDVPQTRLVETNLIGRALADASTRLAEQAEALIQSNHDLERRVQDRTREVSDQAGLITATLDNMDQGLMLVEADGSVPICNQRARQLLDLPVELMDTRPLFTEVLRFQIDKDDFRKSDEALRLWVQSGGLERTQHTYERERPNGKVLEIRTVPLANGGAVRTYTDVTARKEAERLSYHMARHDALTSLPNRTLLRERLVEQFANIGRQGGSFAVLSLDLDRFKNVNDTLGHQAGDALLRQVAGRIASALRSEDVVARLGGDEFAVIQIGGVQPNAASALAHRLVEDIRQPYDLDGQVASVGVSVGIAVAPADGPGADDIFKSADLALYRAKSDGRNTVRFYEAGMDLAIQARQALEFDLRHALARGEFELHYQPLVDAGDHTITGFEALVRWRHPARGLIPPGDFIPLAEDTRLIVPIGAWVLREACREAATWPADTRVLVNLSAIQIEDPGLTAHVLSALAFSGLDARRLQLEVTETVLMNESESALLPLQALRGGGISIVLDDFGTGYSSLSYLQNFPLDGVKIDRSFVHNHQNATTAAIFQAVVNLGAALGISVTAEGVETEEQLDFVCRAGCQEIQGFLFSQPVPAAGVRGLLQKPMRARAA
ncbi:EAL domain-containing protein [uncultured Enterovirga sp.]|uniref:bifunctional diguanylate cyclase/phosphodiesterase n=1 Tax=uncultured Enterovirga sp. TaxID=2026352 RepID=UPI0035CBB94F